MSAIYDTIKNFFTGKKEVLYKVNGKKFLLVIAVILVCFIALIARFYFVQIHLHDEYVSKGQTYLLRTNTEGMQRGIIVDRNDQILAVSVPVGDVVIDLHDFKEDSVLDKHEDILRDIASVLQIEFDELLNRINNHRGRILYVKKRVNASIVNYIKSLGLRSVYIQPSLRRYYPTAEVNAHLIGRVNMEGDGVEGIERQYNDFLLSIPKKSHYLKDLKNNVIEYLNDEDPNAKNAQKLVLSIDERIQQKAYMSLKYATEINDATSGSLVLIDSWTGEILAMVNSPSYNPNQTEKYEPYKAKNRAVTDVYEPGSTTKPLVALKALELGKVSWREIFSTRALTVGGKAITDSHRMDSANLFDIIKFSSNIGMARIALRMTSNELRNALLDFGYGEKTGVGFIGENKGNVPNRKHWSDLDRAVLGYGYGYGATPLQIAQAYSILANKGVRIPLTIQKVVDKSTIVGERVASEKNVVEILKSLEAVVDDGTGLQANVAGYRVGGKTGTAKVSIAGSYGNLYVGTFAGMAPMSNPRFVMVVIINQPHNKNYYGGVVAGPVFAEVMERTLQLYNIPYDNLNADGTVKTPQQIRREMLRRRYQSH